MLWCLQIDLLQIVAYLHEQTNMAYLCPMSKNQVFELLQGHKHQSCTEPLSQRLTPTKSLQIQANYDIYFGLFVCSFILKLPLVNNSFFVTR